MNAKTPEAFHDKPHLGAGGEPVHDLIKCHLVFMNPPVRGGEMKGGVGPVDVSDLRLTLDGSSSYQFGALLQIQSISDVSRILFRRFIFGHGPGKDVTRHRVELAGIAYEIEMLGVGIRRIGATFELDVEGREHFHFGFTGVSEFLCSRRVDLSSSDS